MGLYNIVFQYILMMLNIVLVLFTQQVWGRGFLGRTPTACVFAEVSQLDVQAILSESPRH